jgi:orotate phosphoribosyltransferase
VKSCSKPATPRWQGAINNGRAHAVAVADTITTLLAGRGGHFRMESGYHSAAWFDLDSLFDRPNALRPFVAELAARLAIHRVDAVCGPMTGGAKLARLVSAQLRVRSVVAERVETAAAGLFPIRYEILAAQRSALRGMSVAIVDDAISAGSAVRGTYADLIACGARPAALGALIVFGDAAAAFAAEIGVALEAVERLPFDMWPPADCPLCRTGVALEVVAG